MGILEDYMEIRQRLDAAITVGLELDVANGLSQKIYEKAVENVYSYNPSFFSRREDFGGIGAATNLDASVSGNVLTIRNTTGLQNLYGGDDDSPLAPIIEEGVEAYHMPYPRPFMEEARDEYITSGEAAEDLANALRRKGFEVI